MFGKKTDKELIDRAESLRYLGVEEATEADLQGENMQGINAVAYSPVAPQSAPEYVAEGAYHAGYVPVADPYAGEQEIPNEMRKHMPPQFRKSRRIHDAHHELNRMGMIVVVQILLMVVLEVLVIMLFSAMGIYTTGIEQSEVYWMMALMSVLSTLAPGLLYVWFKRGLSVKKMLDFEHVGGGVAFLCVLAGFAICLLANYPAAFVDKLLEYIGYSPIKQSSTASFDASALIYILSVCFLAPVFEEFVFRGVILKRLERYGSGFAIVGSSVFFGLAHLSVSSVIFAFIAGLVMGYLYVKTRNLWVPIAVHFANNALSTFNSYSAELFGDAAELVHEITFIVFIGMGMMALLGLILFKSSLFRNPMPRRERRSIEGVKSLTARETGAAIVRSPVFWVMVGMTVVLAVFMSMLNLFVLPSLLS